MCMPKPKTPNVPDPKLPRQALRRREPAKFSPNEEGDGFGQVRGRRGKNRLRISRRRSDPAQGVSVPGAAGSSSIQIGAQIPG